MAWQVLQRAVFDGAEYGLLFHYHDGQIAAAIKRGEVRPFYVHDANHPYRRYWRFHRSIMDNAQPFEVLISTIARAVSMAYASVRQEFLEALAEAEINPGAFGYGITQTVYPIGEREFVVIGSKFHAIAVKTFKEMGGRWLKEAGGWHLRDTSLPMLVTTLEREAGYDEQNILVHPGSFTLQDVHLLSGLGATPIPFPTFEHDLSACQDAESEGDHGIVVPTIERVAETGLTEADVLACIPKGAAHDYQVTGAVFMATRTGALNADDMGVGKTRQAILAAYAVKLKHERKLVILVVPKSVRYKWEREILAIYPEEKVQVLEGVDVAPEAEWVLLNYEQAGKWQILGERACALIVDEAHKLKTESALRTQAVYALASTIPVRYLLTATPILNRESEMYALLKITGHPLGSMELPDFVSRFAGSREFRAALNEAITGNWMIRRSKHQVLRGKVPGKERNYRSIPMPKKMAQAYQEALNSGTSTFGVLHSTRRFLQEACIKEAGKYLKKEVAKDEKMVVFVNYTEDAYAHAEYLTGLGKGRFVVLTGDILSDAKRQELLDCVQRDDSVKGIVGSYGVLAEGVDLWRANHVYIASQPWTPATQEQAEDRCNRLGQTRLVRVEIPIFAGTIDEAIRELISGKAEIVEDVLDPEEAERAAIRKVTELVKGGRKAVAVV
ncbi:DEAD/DEAH box helicase [Thauera mechernichensis]|jgi:hypothetical protein